MQLLATSDALKTATGWDVEWRKFDSGTDVIAAMASGDVVLSERGSSPLAIAASQGVEMQLIAFSDMIGKAESLIAHNDSGIASVADLKGKRIAVPVDSTAHFSLMGALQHEGIAEGDVTIIALPPDFAPALGKIMRQPQIRCAEVFARLSGQMKVTDDPLEARFRYNWP